MLSHLRRWSISLVGVLLAVVVAGCGGGASTSQPPPSPAPVPFRTEVFLPNLSFPVTMAFAPDGRLFFNELVTGRVRIVQGGVLQAQPFAILPVQTDGERGLLGLAFDPQFASNRFVYVYYSDSSGVHRLVRFTDFNGVGQNFTVLVDQLPSAQIHNGGNIGFGSDGKLYLTMGENGNPANSQDPNVRPGKILRYNSDGTVPADNPFGAGNPAFAIGLRNSFDFAFHPQTGTIYASENGPTCDDELNRIVAGQNYGWRPSYPCGDTDPNFTAPLIRFNNPSIAPTGVAFYTGNVFPQFTGSLFMVDFNTGRVRRFVVNESAGGQITTNEIVVDGGFGQLLDIVQGPDGFIYFSSTTAIMRIVPQ
ncbi:MAG TPA: PQQ-dependent sugar dehydrogenase [Terriglobales bacterium]|nr:PQQ-dependent sugar dehydrogenase [Terriglobales bacterium]